MNKFDVIGFGALNIDYVNKISYSDSENEAIISDSAVLAGGAAGNTICGLAKLGFNCGVVGRVGIDDNANVVIDSFHDFGVDFSHINIDRNNVTGYSHIYVDDQGKNSMFIKPGSNSTLDKHHVNIHYVSSTNWIHYSSFLDEKQFRLQVHTASALAGKVRSSVYIDGYYLQFGYSELSQLLTNIGVVFIDDHDIASLLKTDAIEAAKKLVTDGVETVVIIHSAHESTVVSETEIFHIKTIHTPIFDITGISNAYAAGFIFGQLKGYTKQQSAYMGNALMAFCAEKLGCRTNFPMLQKLVQKMSLIKEEKNVLIVGGGGREHALAWKLSQSPRVKRIYAAPGNYGISEVAHVVPIADTDIKNLKQFVKDKNIDLTIVGPETPLSKGIVNQFEKEGLVVFGPSKEAALLETSKSFAKKFMKKFHIPTAQFKSFTAYKKAAAYLDKVSYPIVIKADGLASGKGVMICQTKKEATEWLTQLMVDKLFGEAGKRVVIEEFLRGEEASIFAFSDGEHVIPLLPAQDHKAIFDGDKGPNTGGMGAYAPALIVTPELMDIIVTTILEPTIRGMKKIGRPYKGILYPGLMITKDGPKVLEYNCRFGDPETQAVLPLLQTDLLEIIEAVQLQTLKNIKITWKDESCVCVVLAAGGYPQSPEKGKVIAIGRGTMHRARTNSSDHVFHAGTKAQVLTAGGRVLGVFSTGKDLQQAIKKAYKHVGHISFENMHHRKDIGKKGLKYVKKSKKNGVKRERGVSRVQRVYSTV